MSRRTFALALFSLVGGALLWRWYTQEHPPGWAPALSSRQVAARVLAEHLAIGCPTAKALVVGNPFAERAGQAAEIYAFEKASLRGLQEGLGAAALIKLAHPRLRPEVVDHPETAPVDPKTTTPLSFLIRDNEFDQLLKANPDFDLIISLIGLPVNVGQSQLWLGGKKPAVALLFPDWRLLGGPEAVRAGFNSGKVLAAVLARPGAPGADAGMDEDYRAEFERRFILVTATNIDELLTKYPQLF